MHEKTVNNSSGGIVTLDLRRWIIILLELPIVIFFLSWLNIFVGVAASALLIFADCLVLKNKTSGKMILTVEKKKLLILFVVALIWCWLGGTGGFFYQYLDYNWRNAIFHDLINYDWPVIYEETQRMLDYFIGVWLFPALVGKFFLLVGASAAVAWYAANAVLLIYCSLCVFTVFLSYH
ncbi:MAG: hypothetical protein LUG95_04795 [Clostridiales bacterium]|nr:hypothetical protein [Clostridiales bacterium]